MGGISVPSAPRQAGSQVRACRAQELPSRASPGRVPPGGPGSEATYLAVPPRLCYAGSGPSPGLGGAAADRQHAILGPHLEGACDAMSYPEHLSSPGGRPVRRMQRPSPDGDAEPGRHVHAPGGSASGHETDPVQQSATVPLVRSRLLRQVPGAPRYRCWDDDSSVGPRAHLPDNLQHGPRPPPAVRSER